MGAFALLICLVGLFEVSPLLTHGLSSTPTRKPTPTAGSASFEPTAVPTPSATTPSATAPSGGVAVSGSLGNWRLTVEGSPYEVKGVTYDSPPSDARADMPALRAMGVNTVRTWNTGAATRSLLDAAAASGIRVINGFALSPSADYLTDTTYKTTQLNAIEQWVQAYKQHPGVLLWDVGNEVLLDLQNTYSGTKLAQERNAYAQFIDRVARALHAIDPSHPVTSTDAWTGAWVYYKANAPHLDLYAVNAYGGVCSVKQSWISGAYTVPYLVTESGPAGEWEVPDDENGVPREETDVQKSQAYATAWNCITSHVGVALGATLFNYGVENDFGGVWFNLRTDHLRRLSAFTVAHLYGGSLSANPPPVISNMTLDKTTVPMNGSFTVTASVSDTDGATLSYQILFCSKYIDGKTSLQNIPFTQTGPGSFSVSPPQHVGVWKVYLYAEDGQGNVGIETLSVKVV
jgi:hypothetical protein